LAKALNLPEEGGGVVAGGVIPNSAAEKAGIKGGDVILEVNGKKMNDARALRLLIAETPPGTKVNLRILRGEPGQKPVEKTVAAVLGELPQEALASAGQGAISQGAINHGTMSPSLKVVLAAFLASAALSYLMIAGGSFRKHPWKWLLLVLMVLGPLGITLIVPGGYMERLWPAGLFVGLVWLISGVATLYSYLRHTKPPAPEAE
jgi:hypothetical protein